MISSTKNVLPNVVEGRVSAVKQISVMPRVSDQWLKSILLTLYQRPAITREEIVRSTGLNPASVSQTLQHLSSSGTIVKVGELKSSGGRRREVLKLNPEAGYFIAVDLERSRIRYALTNLVGDTRYRWEQELDFGMGVRCVGPAARAQNGSAQPGAVGVFASPRGRNFLSGFYPGGRACDRRQPGLETISVSRKA